MPQNKKDRACKKCKEQIPKSTYIDQANKDMHHLCSVCSGRRKPKKLPNNSIIKSSIKSSKNANLELKMNL